MKSSLHPFWAGVRAELPLLVGVFPELLIPEKHLDLSLGNSRLLAGLVAILVAAWTKNSLLTILLGMAALLIFRALGF